MQDHIVVYHTKMYPHICDVCGKGFTVKQFSQRFEHHRKTCIGEGPKIMSKKECKECKKSFKTLSRFKRHIISHTGAQDFQCSDCGKAYADKNNL